MRCETRRGRAGHPALRRFALARRAMTDEAAPRPWRGRHPGAAEPATPEVPAGVPCFHGRVFGLVLSALLCALVLVCSAQAQEPKGFNNLKVLPKATSEAELHNIMEGFSAALGVRCDFCHARQSADPRSEIDWASDSKPEKETARMMLRMTQMINVEQLPRIKDRDAGGVQVKCATCHHGQTLPRLIEDVLTEAYAGGGLDALKAKYNELRQEHYGSAAYDFSEGMLPRLAERFEEKPGADAAVGVARFNLELFPNSGDAHLALGKALAAKGEKDAAREELGRAVELNPDLKNHVQWILKHL